MRNPYWTSPCPPCRITCIFYYHHIHQSIGNFSHLPCRLDHWSWGQMLVLARSILVACWKRTWYLLCHYYQTCPGSYQPTPLYLAKTSLVHLYLPWVIILSSYEVLSSQGRLFRIILRRIVGAILFYFHLCTSLDSLCCRICKILFQGSSTWLYQDSRCSPLQIYFNQLWSCNYLLHSYSFSFLWACIYYHSKG